MAKDIKLWKILPKGNNEILKLIPSDRLSKLSEKERDEDDLRKWIIHNPNILYDGLKILAPIIKKDGNLSGEKESIDILGLDRDGTVVVIETKRDDDKRGSIAQVVEDAAFVSDQQEEKEKWLREIAKENNVDISSFKKINMEFPKMLIVATYPNENQERMVRFLTKYELDINLVIIQYHKDDVGNEYLTRSDFLTEETKKDYIDVSKRITTNYSEAEYIDLVNEISGPEVKEKLVELLNLLHNYPQIQYRIGKTEKPSMMIEIEYGTTLLYFVMGGQIKVYVNDFIKAYGSLLGKEYFKSLETLGFKKDKPGIKYFINILDMDIASLDNLIKITIKLDKDK
ncbi:MAG: hypothetical protein KGZ86_01335 [Candidatus Latescibacteria bacterium]|nr:hypothetical protein [Candidatus Latescibacterota bacterium]